MKKIVFNVPDNTEVMHVVCVNPYVMRNGKIGTNLNAQSMHSFTTCGEDRQNSRRTSN